MKNLFWVTGLLLLCMIISCNDNAKSGSDTNNQAELNKKHMTSVYRGIESGDMSSMDEFLADDAVDHGDMQELKGRENIKKSLADLHNHFTDLKFDMIAEGTSSSGEYHFALVRMTGTTKEAGMGMPANTHMDQTSVDVVKFVNGKATEHWSYQDPKEIMKMMNMNKPPEPSADKMMDKKDTMPKK